MATHLDPWPDLRHVRYVQLSPHPPGKAPIERSLGAHMLQNALIGACAAGSLSIGLTGRPDVGLLIGGTLGVASGLLANLRKRPQERSFALVPWGVLVEAPEAIHAVRWSGVHALDVRYRALGDGTVRTRVAVESVHGSFVGWASDAVDFGALAGNLADVAAASSRPLAVDLAAHSPTVDSEGARDGEPFVERVLDAAKRLLHAIGETTLGLESTSYRQGHAPSSQDSRVARALRALGLRASADGSSGAARDHDPWGLVAAVAGELRLAAFGPELARLSNAPHPGVASIARAAMGRIRREVRDLDLPFDLSTSDRDDGEALAWFVPPEELARLRAWRDA